MAAQIRMAALTLSLVVRSLPLATRVAHETSRSNLPARPRRLRAGGGAGGLSSTFFLAIFWVEHVSLASVVSGRGKPATRAQGKARRQTSPARRNAVGGDGQQVRVE